jgi:hypothetical protein
VARYAVAAAVVAGLALGVWLLWPRGDVAGPGTTLPTVEPTSSGSTGTTEVPGTDPSHVVETVEEAEEVLRGLWFGWFEGIYHQDEDRIREVVATEEQVETAREQFGVMEFVAEPTPEALVFTETEILRSDEECLAVWVVLDARSFLGTGGTHTGVDVYRHTSTGWRYLSSWVYREDLWQGDCEALLSPSS